MSQIRTDLGKAPSKRRAVSEEDKFWDEVRKASRRIGFSSEDAMEWLLRFTQVDLPELSAGQWADLRAELEVFFHCGPPKSDHDMADRFFFAGYHEPPTWSDFIDRTGDVPEFQSTLKKSLSDLVKKGMAEFPPIRVTPQVIRKPHERASQKAEVSLRPLGDRPLHRLIYTAASLIEAHKDRIQGCVECGRFFLAYRGGQRFCSSRCQNRFGQRQLRTRRQEQEDAALAQKDSKRRASGKSRFAIRPGKMRPLGKRPLLPSKGSL